MPETMTDEAILQISDDAPVEASEESGSLGDSLEQGEQSESAGEQQSETSQAEAQSSKTATEPTETAEQETPSPLNELFPQGEAQAKEALSKAGELDAMDAALRSGDAAGLAEVVLNTYQQSPETFPLLLSMGLDILKQNNPQQFAQLAAYLSGEQKPLNPVAQRAPEPAPAVQSATESAEWQDFTAAADGAIRDFIDADIRRALGPQFNAVAKGDAKELLERIRDEIQDAGKRDRGMNLAFLRALQGGLTRESGVAAVNLVVSKLQTFVPGIVGRVLQQFPLGQLQQAAPAPARPKVAAKPVATPPAPVAKPASLTQDEANQMTWDDILSSGRVGQRRGTWRPENVFDAL
jgi:hypothetical protein